MAKRSLVLAVVLGMVALGVSATAGGCNGAELKSAGQGTSGSTSGGPDVPDEAGAPIDGGGAVPRTEGGVAVVVPKSTKVTIQVQPTDAGAAVEAAIRAAKTSVHMTMYLLTSTKIIDALGDLKDAGKDVKVVLNKTFPPDGGDNGPAFAKLQARGVPVVYAPSVYTFTHEKTVIIDDALALIMTMNLTQTDDNREYIATDGDAADVADAEKLFQADFAGSAVNIAGNLIVSPKDAAPVDAGGRLKQLIDSATQTLDIEVQSLSDDGLTSAIIAAHQAGVTVRLVLSGAPGSTTSEDASAAKIKAAGVPVKTVVTPYIHAKAIVVDNATVFVGSQNFTPTALFYNRELGVVTDAPAEATKVRDVIAADFAAGMTP